MSKQSETQEERVAKVRAYLISKPGVPCEMLEIGKATGISKSRIDYERSLSSAPDILREKRMDEGE